MKGTTMKNRIPSFVLVALLVTVSHAYAEYPEKPVRLVVAFPGGTVPDVMARVYAEKIKELWHGQPLLVEPRPGATGTVGAELVARAPADGYTLLLNSSGLMISPWLLKTRFDVFKDLVPLIRTAYTPYLILTSGKLPIKTFDEFIDYAKKHPGQLSCATYGIGSPPHIALELLNREAGVNILHVPYSTTNSLPDTVAGTVDCSIAPPLGQDQYVKSGQVRAIAHTGNAPIALYPDAVPIGKIYPAATVLGWQAIYAPASTPKPIVEKLRSDWSKVLADPIVVQRIRDVGFEPMKDSSIDDATRSMRDEYEKFGDLVKSRGIKVQ